MAHPSDPTNVLLLLDLPPSALAGIDLLSFTTTPRFRGIRDLPRGWHFVFVGATSGVSERHGVWVEMGEGKETLEGGDVVVLTWDGEEERLVRVHGDAVEGMRARANLGEIVSGGRVLGYRQSAKDGEGEGDWPVLTRWISSGLMERILGSEAMLSSGSSARRDLDDIPGLDLLGQGDEPQQQQQQDQLASAGIKELHLLPVNLKQTWPPNATGRERTVYAQDRSWALLHLTSPSNLDSILGELQFCFLMLLTLNNFSCLSQWTRLLELIFTSVSAVPDHPDFFITAISVLRLQLHHLQDAEGGSLIDLTDESGSLLKALLTRFRNGVEGLTGSTAIQDVLDELEDVEDYLRSEHHWSFGGEFARSGVLELEDGEQVRVESTAYDEEDETGEFAPQIVELTAEQARLLGVTPEDAKVLGRKLEKADLNEGVGDVVQDSGDDGEGEEEDSEGRRDKGESDEEEEMQDLDDMDSRY